MNIYRSVLLSLVIAGCGGGGDLDPYYSGGPVPDPEAISQHREDGNVGGDTVRIVGQNFGGDLDAITVLFGSQNAEIVSISADEISVVVPQGPVQGGRVDVVVATSHGQGFVPGGYEYDVGALLQDQAGYIIVTDQWESCFGGIGKGSAQVGCDQIAYTGHTGIEGRAAFLDIKFPNVHSMYVGWGTGSDMTTEWKVQTPGQMVNSFDTESSFEDIKSSKVSGLRLVNESWDDEDISTDSNWCADLNHLETYRYNGGFDGDEYIPPFSISGAGNPESELMGTSLIDEGDDEDGECTEASGRRLYDRRELNFCEVADYVNPHTQDFEANWPVGKSFFVGLGSDDGETVLDDRKATNVRVDVPGIGLNETVRVPPAIEVSGTQGFVDPGVDDDTLWSIMTPRSCDDSNEDGDFNLDDAAFTFQWEPYSGDLTDGGVIRASRTYVRLTITVLDIGWFGGVGSPIRASITVPDEYNVDPSSDLSTLEVPAWVMYQFPTVDSEWGTESAVGTSTQINWGNPLVSDYGYLVITLDRVTEYTLHAADLEGGDVVFAYTSGDVGFMNWANPLDDPDECDDCSDNDGDGWVDRDDPDCRSGDYENNASYGDYTCNDGIDNDGDGYVDAMDDNCTEGRDPESPECGDEIDNDEDGWTDDDDPDCSEGAGLFEDNSRFGEYGCNDGIDNDGDGWIDSVDLACSDATDPEDDGYADDDEDGVPDHECNDGIDNDGNGDIDAEDTLCVNKGPKHEVEHPENSDECIDGLDNDEDGFIDIKDPDCEFSPYSFERREFRDPEVYEGIDQCYDGIDNDGDGGIDAADPGCLDAEGNPNGFIDDESLALFEGTVEDGDTGSTDDDSSGSSTDTGDEDLSGSDTGS